MKSVRNKIQHLFLSKQSNWIKGDIYLLGIYTFAIQFFVWSSFAFANSDQLTKPKLLELIKKDVSALVPEHEMPKTYKVLRQNFERLANAQVKNHPGYRVSNELHILTTDNIEAFISPVQRDGYHTLINMTFISRGFLKEFLPPDLTAEEANRRLESIVGVLAHELSHPNDITDSQGIKRKHGWKGQQAIEVRTDWEAVHLLRDAGFPVASLFDALEWMTKDLSKPYPLIAGITSHPEKQLRLSLQQIAITLDWFKQGDGTSKTKVPLPEWREIAFEVAASNPKEIKIPDSLDELVIELESRTRSNYLTSQELNILLLWINQNLKRGLWQNQEEHKKVELILSDLLDRGGEICTSRKCLQDILSNTTALKSLELVPQWESARTLDFYNKSEMIREKFNSLLAEYFPTRRLFHYLNRNYLDTYQNHLVSESPDKATLTFSGIDRLLPDHLNWNEFFYWAEFIHFRLLPRFSKNPDFLSLFEVGMRNFIPLIDIQSNKKLWSQLRAVDTPKAEKERLKVLLQKMWENRGQLAWFEFDHKGSRNIDWFRITGPLGIDPKHVHEQIREKFHDYVKVNGDNSRRRLESSTSSVVLKRDSGPAPSWLDSSTYEVLISLKQNSRLSPEFIDSQIQKYFIMRPQSLKKIYRQQLEMIFQDANITRPKQIFARIMDIGTKDSLILLEQVIMPIVDAAKKSTFSQSVLDEFFWNYLFEYFEYLSPRVFKNFKPEEMRVFFRILSQSKKFSGFIEFFELGKLGSDKQWKIALAQEILHQFTKELSQTPSASYEILERYYLLLVGNKEKEIFEPGEFPTSKEMTAAFIKTADLSAMDDHKKETIFFRLTKISTNKHTDEFLKTVLWPIIRKEPDGKTAKKILESSLVASNSLKVDIVEDLQKSYLQSEVDVVALTDEINKLLPASTEKDRYLESLAWKLGLTGITLKKFIQDNKASNWKNYNPNWVRATSAISVYIQNLDYNLRVELLDYLINSPKNGTLPPRIYKKIYEDIAREYAVKLHTSDPEKANRRANQVKSEIENFMRNSLAVEKVPLITTLLNLGSAPLAENLDLQKKLIADHLKMKPGSTDYIFLRSYLDVISKEKRATTLAYLLANSGGESSRGESLKLVFEMFGTVGIKFGQLAQIWSLFPTHNEELKSLFDRAAPMDKHEIEVELKKYLSPSQATVIIEKLEKILGSASIKTVVLSSLLNGEDGKKIAVMLQRPAADNLIKTNLNLAKKYIRRLKHYSVESENSIFLPMVEALEQQIFSETDFLKEIQNFKKMKQLVPQLNNSIGNSLKGWTFDVPAVSKSFPQLRELYAVEAVSGVTAKVFLNDPKISASKKAHVGELITKFSLKLFFDFGYFDPDRHLGNWIIDEKENKVYFIDPGQLIDFKVKDSAWKWDPRMTIGAFLRSSNNRNAKEIAYYASLMTARGNAEVSVLKAATETINKTLSDKSLKDEALFTKIIEGLYSSGIKFDHVYTFGALKGLMVLRGSGYVSDEKFEELLAKEIKSTSLRKIPAIVKNKLSRIAGVGRGSSNNKCLNFYK